MDYAALGKKIKEKYPAYQNVDDEMLGLKVAQKFPKLAEEEIAPPSFDYPTTDTNVYQETPFQEEPSFSTARSEMPYMPPVDPEKEVRSSLFDKVKNSAIDFLPTIGAIAGGIPGGMAAGPFGAIPAAAAGSAAGEALRQKIKGEPTNVRDIKKQGVIGAAGEGAGSLVGAVLRPVGRAITQKIPKKLMESVFKEPMKATKAAIQRGKSLGQEALERGEQGGATSLFQKAVSKTQELEDVLQNKLLGSSHTVDIEDIRKTVKPLIDKYVQAGNNTAAKSITDRLAQIESANGSKIPAAAANEIKRSIYDEARNAYGTEASANMEGLKSIARGIKESLAKIPGIDQINKDLSFFGRTADSMTDNLARGERNNMFGLGDTIMASGGVAAAPFTGGASLLPVIASKVLGTPGGKTAIAQGLNKMGKMSNLLPPISSTVGQGVVRGTKALVSPVTDDGEDSYAPQAPDNESPKVEHTLPTISQDIPQSQNMEPTDATYLDQYEKELDYLDQWKQENLRSQTTEKGRDMVNEMYDDAVNSAKRKYDLGKDKAELTKPEKKLSAAAAKDLSRNQTASRDVLEFEKILNDDPTVILKSAIPGSPGARQYRSLWGSILDTIGTNRTGAAYTIEQRKDYAHLMPVVGDSQQTVQAKIKKIKDEINTYTRNLEGAGPDDIGEPQSMLPEIKTPQGQKKNSVSILPSNAPITQKFGQKSKYDVFSKGVNYGTDFAVPTGTPVSLPEGRYKIVETYAKSPNKGRIGNSTNKGYGNSVLVQDLSTGERLRFSHLSQVNVKPGQTITGGQIGLSGKSGNATGDHLDVEYYNPRGQISDVMRSKYGKQIFNRQTAMR